MKTNQFDFMGQNSLALVLIIWFAMYQKPVLTIIAAANVVIYDGFYIYNSLSRKENSQKAIEKANMVEIVIMFALCIIGVLIKFRII